MPFDNTIKRMFVIVKNMHEDAIAALETHNKELAQDVIVRDMDADRLNWLIARQTNMIMQNASLSRKMEISQSLAMHYYMLSRIIERVGDHAVRIAEILYRLSAPISTRRSLLRSRNPYPVP